MPKLNGFEVLELLGREVPVIFITAYDQYALRAFEVHAVDYLLKPFSEERFAEALVARARAAAGAPRRRRAEVDALIERRAPRGSAGARADPRRRAGARPAGREASTTSRRRTTTSASRRTAKQYLKDQTLPTRRGRARSGALRPHPPFLSAEHRAASRGSSCMPRTAGWRSCATAPACRSAAPATRGWPSCCRLEKDQLTHIPHRLDRRKPSS